MNTMLLINLTLLAANGMAGYSVWSLLTTGRMLF